MRLARSSFEAPAPGGTSRLPLRSGSAPSAITPLIQLGGDQGEEGLPSLAVGGAGFELESGGKQS
jgi:hypothetical protein